MWSLLHILEVTLGETPGKDPELFQMTVILLIMVINIHNIERIPHAVGE